jgi:hypothetical protein
MIALFPDWRILGVAREVARFLIPLLEIHHG